MDSFFGSLGVIIAGVILFTAFVLYVLNIVRIVKCFTSETYSILLLSRIIGVFFPIWGAIMGCVK